MPKKVVNHYWKVPEDRVEIPKTTNKLETCNFLLMIVLLIPSLVSMMGLLSFPVVL